MALIDEPPVADYDRVTVLRLPRLIKGLDEGELAAALKYEAAHADRPVVKRMLTLRMMQVAAEHAASASPDAQPSSRSDPSSAQNVLLEPSGSVSR